MNRLDVALRNQTERQRLAVSESWKNPEARNLRLKKLVEARKCYQLGNKNALGHKVSQEQRQRQSEALRGRFTGPNHPRWKGGISCRSLNTAHYREWRTAIFERDDYTCRLCECRGGTLEAHHIRRWKNHPDLRFDISNGITLCYECHKGSKGREAAFAWRLVFTKP